MKVEDFDRLKAICEKEGFIIDHFNGLYAIKEKDIWDGVEYVRFKYPKPNQFACFKVVSANEYDFMSAEQAISKNNCEPITQEAYEEFLKREAFKKYGEIKEGDRFERSWCSLQPVSDIREGFQPDFNYYKDSDALTFQGTGIYREGKWATKLPKRVEVNFLLATSDEKTFKVKFDLPDAIDHMKNFKGGDSGRFLAEQLEKYLNNEI